MPQPETRTQPSSPAPAKTLILACGALVRELRAVLPADPLVGGRIEVDYLPAPLHNRPEKITPAIADRLAGLDSTYDRIILGYGDCGTGGHLDAFIESWNQDHPSQRVSRIPGDHCYAFLTGLEQFERLHAAELGTLFLTDYFARHFDLLIWQALGIADHPELRDMYFANYKRVVYIAQTEDPELQSLAAAAADRLGLAYEYFYTGLDVFSAQVSALATVSKPTPVTLASPELA